MSISSEMVRNVVSRYLLAKGNFKSKTKDPDGNIHYEYGPRQVSNRNNEKASRIEHLKNIRGGLIKKLKTDYKSKNLKTRLTALAVGLIDHTYERVGNPESAAEGHFGVTGWKVKHFKVNGGKGVVSYVGKSGVKQTKSIKDPGALALLREVTKGRGPDENIFEVDGVSIGSTEVNEYLPKGITAKDLRGLHANQEMQTRLQEISKGLKNLPNDRKDKTKVLTKHFEKALAETAIAVGHEASTLKTHYLVPGMVDNFLHDGTVEDSFEKKATKDEYEKDQEGTEDLIKPKPTKKPPRHDLRKRVVDDLKNDPDLERCNATNDRDLSQNYKKIGASLVEYKDPDVFADHVFYMPLSKDVFVHFTPKSRGDEILKSGRLLYNPPYRKFGLKSIGAVSAVWGHFIPQVQTTHIKTNEEMVAVVFTTNTLPESGFPEEVLWNKDVVFKSSKVVSLAKGVSMIKSTPDKVPDDSYVVYKKPSGKLATIVDPKNLVQCYLAQELDVGFKIAFVEVEAAVEPDWVKSVRKAWKVFPNSLKRVRSADDVLDVIIKAHLWVRKFTEDLAYNKGFFMYVGDEAKQKLLDPSDAQKQKAMNHLQKADQILGKIHKEVAFLIKSVDFMSEDFDSSYYDYFEDKGKGDVEGALLKGTLGLTLKAFKEADSEISRRLLRQLTIISKGVSQQVDVTPTDKEVSLGGVKVVFEESGSPFMGRQEFRGNLDEYAKKAYIKELLKTKSILERKGLGKLWYGPIFIRCKTCGGSVKSRGKSFNVGAHYFPNKDFVVVYSQPSSDLGEFVAHELGHRYYFKFMSVEDRARFAHEFGDIPAVSSYGGTNAEEDFAEVFAHYIDGKNLTSDQLRRFKMFLGRTSKRAAEEDVVDLPPAPSMSQCVALKFAASKSEKLYSHKSPETGESSQVKWNSLTPEEQSQYREQGKGEDEPSEGTSKKKEDSVGPKNKKDKDKKNKKPSTEEGETPKDPKEEGDPTKEEEGEPEPEETRTVGEQLTEMVADAEFSKGVAEILKKLGEKASAKTLAKELAKKFPDEKFSKELLKVVIDANKTGKELPDVAAELKAKETEQLQKEFAAQNPEKVQSMLDEMLSGAQLPEEEAKRMVNKTKKMSPEDQMKVIDSMREELEDSVGQEIDGDAIQGYIRYLKKHDEVPSDPAEMGKYMGKRVYAQNVVFNPLMAGGYPITDRAKSDVELERRSSQAFDQFKNLGSSHRQQAGEQLDTILKEIDPDSAPAKEIKALQKGLALASTLNGENTPGMPPPSALTTILAKGLERRGEESSLLNAMDPNSPDFRNKMMDSLRLLSNDEIADYVKDDPVMGALAKKMKNASNESNAREYRQIMEDMLIDNVKVVDPMIRDAFESKGQKDKALDQKTREDLRREISQDSTGLLNFSNNDIPPGLARSLRVGVLGTAYRRVQSWFGNVNTMSTAMVRKALNENNLSIFDEPLADPISKPVESEGRIKSDTKMPKVVNRYLNRKPSNDKGKAQKTASQSEAYITRQMNKEAHSLSSNGSGDSNMRKITKQGAIKFSNNLDDCAQVVQTRWRELGFEQQKHAIDFAYRCDLVCDLVERTAGLPKEAAITEAPGNLKNDDGARVPGKAVEDNSNSDSPAQTFNPESIGKIKAPSQTEPDEPYMDAFDQDEMHQLNDVQQSGGFSNAKAAFLTTLGNSLIADAKSLQG